jgi:hypothetical protein
VIKIKVQTKEEFESYLVDNGCQISMTIIDIIEKNINNKKNHIPVFEVLIEEDQEILDITLERKNFVDTLNKNLITLEKFEQYEYCSKTINLINKIQN